MCALRPLRDTHRREKFRAKQIAELPCIYLIILVAHLQQGVLPRMACDQMGHVWFQQVVQPNGTGAFLEADHRLPCSPRMNSRTVDALVSMTHSITNFPAPSLTATEMLVCQWRTDLAVKLPTLKKRLDEEGKQMLDSEVDFLNAAS